MGLLEDLGKSIRNKLDERGSDYIKSNRRRLTDEQLLNAYAKEDGICSEEGSKSRNALRDELKRRGFRDLD